MVGGPALDQGVHLGFKQVHRGAQRGVRCGRIGKAHDADPAATADVAVLGTIRGLVDDVDEGVRPQLQVFQRDPRHAAGAVQQQHHIRGVFRDIRRRRQGQGHL